MNKKEILDELETLKKLADRAGGSFDALQLALTHDKSFRRILFRSDTAGQLMVYYDNFTLTFYLKCDNIIIGDIVNIWDNSGTGFVGSFTERTLQMEGSGELD